LSLNRGYVKLNSLSRLVPSDRSFPSQLGAIAFLFHKLGRSLGWWGSIERSPFSFTAWSDRSVIGIQRSDRSSLSQLGAIALLVGFSGAIAAPSFSNGAIALRKISIDFFPMQYPRKSNHFIFNE